jgi:putative oxidoreductase
MKQFWLVTLPRVVLGLIFLVGAIDGFAFIFTGSHLIHPLESDRGLQFQGALEATDFFWPLMKTVELIGALCLLSNRAPAFGLAIPSPVITVIVLFHLFLSPQGIPLALLLVICGALMLRAYASRYESMFRSGKAA